MPLKAPVEQPFTVFISSRESEFREFRQDLKEAVNSERWADQRLMTGILIEDQRRPVVFAEIRRELDKSSVYIGIFGRQHSDWTVAEFKYAKSLGLPLMVYVFGGGGSRHRPGRRSRVTRFMNEEVRPIVKVREPYTKLDPLLDAIMSDLAVVACDMVREATDIRKRLNVGNIGLTV